MITFIFKYFNKALILQHLNAMTFKTRGHPAYQSRNQSVEALTETQITNPTSGGQASSFLHPPLELLRKGELVPVHWMSDASNQTPVTSSSTQLFTQSCSFSFISHMTNLS